MQPARDLPTIPSRAPHAPPTRLSRPRKPGVPTGRQCGVSIVGYDDDTLCRLSSFNLTTVNLGAKEQARHAVTAAVERLDQDRTETWVTDGTDMDADTQVQLGQCSQTSGPPPRHSTSPDRATSISSQSCKPAS
ncbi:MULTISPECIES: substrate-binding domain-containing protein [Streptomyces]|uniref:substrate-binding domain-containing protein n=1 Tax=Streptomyces TaxID=1883 RepID=UPI00099E7333|nr:MULTISPECIES: substrate-binding domain-containing protein [Streptomyces]MDI5905205.1 substrate-binding domain-containing protein [Streptomyces sp. 12257]